MEDLVFVRDGEQILRGLSWEGRRDEHWVILGPNGSGKSTVAAMICGYEWPTRGRVSVLGETYGNVDLRKMRERIGFFQPALQAQLDVFHPGATALDVVLTGYDGSLARYRDYPPGVEERARALFAAHFDTQSFAPEREFRKLSSGERRKVLLLRLFLSDPELILLDEPYESLDIPSRAALERMLNTHVRAYGVPVLTILHRIEEIPVFATHVAMIKDGAVAAAGEIESTLTAEKLSALYDVPLKLGRDAGRYYCVVLS